MFVASRRIRFGILSLWFFIGVVRGQQVSQSSASPLSKTGTKEAGVKCPNKYVEQFVLPPNYNKYEFPTSRNENCSFEKLPVTIGIRIRNIRGVVDLEEELVMEVDLITSWKDYVLADMDNKTEADFNKERGTDYIALESSFITEIWTPDIIFSKAISIAKPAVHSTRTNFKPSKLRIYPGGWVELYTRLLVTLYCPMDFTYFPADTQMCEVRMRSYSFSNDDIDLHWHSIVTGKNKPVEKELVFLYGRSHPNYNIYIHDVTTKISTEYDANQRAENYTVLGFRVSARRKLSYHLNQTFVPTAFLILITWLTFFIPLSNLEARIGVAMTTLLTMTNKFSEIQSDCPTVSYMKAIDYYMMVCIIIVFFTLFEFTFLYWVRMGKMESFESRLSLKKKIPKKRMEEMELEEKPSTPHERFYWKIQNIVEVYGFLFTIIGFLLFNLFFWPWMLISSDYLSDRVDYKYNARLDGTVVDL